jgi:hypothetical protein
MALGSTQPVTDMSTRSYFVGSKGGRCVWLTVLTPSCAGCLEIWEPQPPGNLRAFPGLYRDCITFTFNLHIGHYEDTTFFLFHSFIDKVAYSGVHAFVYRNLSRPSARLPFILGQFVFPITRRSCTSPPPRRIRNIVFS